MNLQGAQTEPSSFSSEMLCLQCFRQANKHSPHMLLGQVSCPPFNHSYAGNCSRKFPQSFRSSWSGTTAPQEPTAQERFMAEALSIFNLLLAMCAITPRAKERPELNNCLQIRQSGTSQFRNNQPTCLLHLSAYLINDIINNSNIPSGNNYLQSPSLSRPPPMSVQNKIIDWLSLNCFFNLFGFFSPH